MKESLTFIGFLCLTAAVFAADAQVPAVIPEPQKLELRPGAFQLTSRTRIYTDWASRKTARFLAARLRPATGYPLKVKTKWFSSAPVPGGILLTAKSADRDLGPEGYELTVTTNAVVIRAPKQAGLFYGIQTLRQLLPPVIFSTHPPPPAAPASRGPGTAARSRSPAGRESAGVKAIPASTVRWRIPCVHIRDWPRFRWRGLMLDVSRHYFNKAQVERLLDLMSLYKLNRFHWHLVDDQGWRIQIKEYPRLTQIGAWRTGVGFGMDPESTTAYGPDGRYGGYYTQADIREVVAYAAARHITIVPEIEMPGHSVAALAAYPQFSCFGGPYSTDVGIDINDGIYCPANDGTFKFLDNILTEVFHLFPGQYVHIGGDEVRKDYWARSPECQALMKREGLKNEKELQSWFIKRMETFINAHGRVMIGWSEILEGGLAPNAVVMDWIGGGKEAAMEGHDVVMSPENDCYFDHYQSHDHSTEPRAFGGDLPLHQVYSYDPIPKGLPSQDVHHVLGAQGNVWTEYIASVKLLDYMVFPRLCALSEVVWSSKDSRNWHGFQQRLKVDERRLDELGVNYRP